MKKPLLAVILFYTFAQNSNAQNFLISGGRDFSLSLCTSGTIAGWGNNASGQTGTGSAVTTPTALTDLNLPARSLQIEASGSHGMALGCDSMVYTWGANAYGQLGHGTNSPSEAVGKVLGVDGTEFLTGVKYIGASKKASYAVTSNNRVVSWGDNTQGKLGNGQQISTATPVNVVKPLGQLTNITHVQGTDSSAVALAVDGTVWTWGSGYRNQLGRTLTVSRSFDVYAATVKKADKTPLQNVIQIAAGGNHVLALDKNGNVWSWGSDIEGGQLGQTDTNDSKPYASMVFAGETPSTSGFLENVVAIAAGYAHSLAVLSDGSVVAWGSNRAFGLGSDSTGTSPNSGQLGLGPGPFVVDVASGVKEQAVDVPRYVHLNAQTKFSKAKYVSSGDNWSFIVTSDTLIYAMGYNANGQLGLGNTTNQGYATQLLLPASCKLGSDCSTITANVDRQKINEILYPNPFTDEVFYDMATESNLVLTISDMHGVDFSKSQLSNPKGSINTQQLPAGVYIFKFASGDNVVVKKIIKN